MVLTRAVMPSFSKMTWVRREMDQLAAAAISTRAGSPSCFTQTVRGLGSADAALKARNETGVWENCKSSKTRNGNGQRAPASARGVGEKKRRAHVKRAGRTK